MSRNQPLLALRVPVELIDADTILSELGAWEFPAFGAVTIADLARLDMRPHGVYVVHDEQSTVRYVGKATSRSLSERLPAHLDPRPDDWFSTIRKRKLGA
jgi:hypothetical protein